MERMKINFLIIGTNKYLHLAQECATSLHKFVQIPDASVECHIFSNCPKVDPFHDNNKYHHVDHLPWPLITLMRYHTFCQYKYDISDSDYLFYIDADMRAVNPIGSEILGNLVGTQHPGLWNVPSHSLPFERNIESTAYIPHQNMYDRYFFGALQGGKTEKYLEMCEKLRHNINADLSRNYIAAWHDESQMNRYFMENPPDTILKREEFAHVEKWFGPVGPQTKIVALEKDHAQYRKE
jgi:hypothetical protein